MKLLLIISAAIVTLLGSPVAQADSGDAAYLRLLNGSISRRMPRH